jgi:menaquinone-dependent protoporphyrinogen oxidase
MRVLVAVASKHGATTEIGTALAETLRASGFETVVRPPEQVLSLDGFDAVILGSAVYMGRWLESARTCAANLEPELRARPTWLFSSGPIGDPPKPTDDPADVAALMKATGAREHRTFAGELNKDGLGFGERAVVTALRAPEGDFRPWPEISAWAAEIVAALRTGNPVSPVG